MLLSMAMAVRHYLNCLKERNRVNAKLTLKVDKGREKKSSTYSIVSFV